jgi:hypothetical protein
MPRVACECGATYNVAADQLGKRGRCKKCGNLFDLLEAVSRQAAPPIGLEHPRIAPPAVSTADSDSDPFAELSLLAKGAGVPQPAPPALPPLPQSVRPDGALPPLAGVPLADAPVLNYATEGVGAGGAWAGYWQALKRTPNIFSEMGNVVAFGIVWFMLIVQIIVQFAIHPCISFLAVFIIGGWYAAFQLSVLVEAADGKDDLPEITLTGGWVDDIIVPFFKMTLASLICMAPVIVFAVSQAMTGGDAMGTLLIAMQLAFFDFEPLLADPAYALPMFALVLAGLFLWPMLLLVAAVGGFGAMVRLDIIVESITKNILSYSVTVVIVYAVMVGMNVAWELIVNEVSGRGNVMNGFIVNALLIGPNVFATIFCMRAIGFNYHFFKDRYAWSWG